MTPSCDVTRLSRVGLLPPADHPFRLARLNFLVSILTKLAMVHLRLNTLESNPNPHINFITSLPADGQAATDSARELLRALAAQIKPVMKAHGFTVNSFEEYEYNNVFAGRNWNAGGPGPFLHRQGGG
jgi:hypothetical protein